MRLGVSGDSRAAECARAVTEAGACELVIHARTRDQGYRPPAYWARIAEVRAEVPGLPIVANGEIWTVADARRCQAESGCDTLMLGRGQVADPGLALAILSDGRQGMAWSDVLHLLRDFWERVGLQFEPRYRAGRLKQWLQLLRQRHPEAAEAHARLRTVNDPAALALGLFGMDADARDQAAGRSSSKREGAPAFSVSAGA
jgi:tRNA-dihydrouridine synthase C